MRCWNKYFILFFCLSWTLYISQYPIKSLNNSLFVIADYHSLKYLYLSHNRVLLFLVDISNFKCY
ncbi:hypothetical protein PPL_12489 [Heterostelium album PN500]|uniref:Uncharacterized protein n=1 Tax=Heterostelium pallidum (strain ATCC 26659 / Pp 5 / PN500) TaxID=670386 RepID=D3BMR6_HETP5|nr:hypothetical protein PPL_12489 [Heterostelium album PN500]EFA77278.1 hypothetical protein PPL_12489 [Heterostelium album PN500]|eukprot:XP_020429407.1 hypothetical protein PPL_12489 [Heterostelium album PN500]